jgi:hypothetical protein
MFFDNTVRFGVVFTNNVNYIYSYNFILIIKSNNIY